MKQLKLKVITIFLALSLALSACGGQTQAPAPAPATPEAPAQQAAPAPEAEPAPATPAVAAGESHVIKICDSQPDGSPIVEHIKLFGDYIKEASDGRITVEVYPSAMMGNGTECMQQVQMGSLDMYRCDASAIYDFGVDSMKIPGLPYLFQDRPHAMKVMYSDIGKKFSQDITDAGIGFVGIGYLIDSQRCMFSNKRVDSLESAKGLKTRSLQAALFVDYKTAIGVSPVPMPFSEVYTSLSTGVIDGAWNTIDGFSANKLDEVCKYFSWTDTLYSAYPMVFSTKNWETYSPEDQKLIAECWQKAMDEYDVAVEQNMAKSIADLEAKGVEFVQLTDKDAWIKAVEPVVNKYSEGYEDLVQQIRDMH